MKPSLRQFATTVQIAGALLLIYCLFVIGQAHLFQAGHKHVIAAAPAQSHPEPAPPGSEQLQPAKPIAGSVLGWIEIPRLNLSTVVLEGYDEPQLRLGAGHVPGTAEPGEPGNVVIAAHRDSFFRALRDVSKGDRVVLTTPTASFVYQVETTQVTGPRDVSVIKPRGGAELTLVTCYPFTFIGSAPDRFIVRARKLDAPS